MKEFRQKVGSMLPVIPKKPSEGRTEFSGINDLLQYLIDVDEQKKKVAPNISQSDSDAAHPSRN